MVRSARSLAASSRARSANRLSGPRPKSSNAVTGPVRSRCDITAAAFSSKLAAALNSVLHRHQRDRVLGDCALAHQTGNEMGLCVNFQGPTQLSNLVGDQAVNQLA